jgi:hypothetical protein
MAMLLVVVGFLFVFLIFFLKQNLPFAQGARQRLWCEKKQQMVEVDFMAVNPNQYDVASCTAFSVDNIVSCDKHCVDAVEEGSLVGTEEKLEMGRDLDSVSRV